MGRTIANARRRAAGLVLVAMWTCAYAADLGRDDEPVVLAGDRVPALIGADPGRIVGFVWHGAWTQFPVQVDERAVVDFGRIYGGDPIGQTILTYTDIGTFTGVDPDPTFDNDDEVLFLAGHAGDARGAAADPAGVVPGSGVEIELRHPVSGDVAYASLFVSDGSLDPAAAAPDIGYVFDLLAGNYPDDYDTAIGPNPENSTVRTAAYEVHFSDRWIRDGTSVTAGTATGVDIVDRHRFVFRPRDCARTEDTFSAGEGAFIVNRTGPVRALRGYVGANSGPTTYRVHEFYPRREIVTTHVRVHRIRGIVDILDHSAAAIGMTLNSNLAPAGAAVDGVPDTVPEGEIRWMLVAGSQGAMASAFRIDTDVPDLVVTSYHADDATPETPPCSGDAAEYGAAGPWIDDAIPNTDPSQSGALHRFVLTRYHAYGPPGTTPAEARAFADEVDAPLIVGLADTAVCPDGDLDGYAECVGGCVPDPPVQCGDCDDGDDRATPGGTEFDCTDGVDNDCNGLTDDEDAACAVGQCADDDGDGWFEPGCEPGGSTLGEDCHDGEPAIHPGAPEVCNGVDDDCSDTADDGACGDYGVNDDDRVDGIELAWLGRAFGECSQGSETEWWATVDYDGNGCVDGDDLAVLANLWGRPCVAGVIRCE